MNGFRNMALAAALALTAGTSLAGTARADGFWDRLHNQQDRIEQGVDNGSLTRDEARRLEAQERDLKQDRARLARGGLSQGERERLQERLNRQSARIYDQRHDDQTNWRAHDRYADNDGWRDRDHRRDRDDHRDNGRDHDRRWWRN
jgi:hypothetical protein